MTYVLGIITGVLLSGIALYGATRLAKPLNGLFTVNPIDSSTNTGTEPIQMAQIIKRTTPQERFLSQDE